MSSFSEDLSRIYTSDNLSEKKQTIAVFFALTGELVAEIKHEQALYGKPRAIKKLLERAQKVEDNQEEIQKLSEQYQEAKTSKKVLSEKGQLLKDLKKHQKHLSLTIKKG